MRSYSKYRNNTAELSQWATPSCSRLQPATHHYILNCFDITPLNPSRGSNQEMDTCTATMLSTETNFYSCTYQYSPDDALPRGVGGAEVRALVVPTANRSSVCRVVHRARPSSPRLAGDPTLNVHLVARNSRTRRSWDRPPPVRHWGG